MSGPGKGRYTTYVPTSTDTSVTSRYTLLWKLFNANSGEKGKLYGATTERTTSNSTAAEEAAKIAATYLLPTSGQQAGDPQMFPNGVNLSYGNSPDLTSVKWDSAKTNFGGGPTTNFGGPANAYVPDISSPGEGKTNGLDKNKNPDISVADVSRQGYVPAGPDTGTVSPSTTSPKVGKSPIGNDLTPGKSSV